MENNIEIKVNDFKNTLTVFCVNGVGTLELSMMKPNIYYFNRLVVKSKYRNMGIASNLMKTLIKTLKNKNDFIKIDMEINPYGDLDYDQLSRFYCKFGFEKLKDNKDKLYILTKETVDNYLIEGK